MLKQWRKYPFFRSFPWQGPISSFVCGEVVSIPPLVWMAKINGDQPTWTVSRQGFEWVALLKSYDHALALQNSEALNGLQGESEAEWTVVIQF